MKLVHIFAHEISCNIANVQIKNKVIKKIIEEYENDIEQRDEPCMAICKEKWHEHE